MFCEKCGKEIGSGEKFCPVCGTKISWENSQETGAANGSGQISIHPMPVPMMTLNQEEYAPIMSVWNYMALFLLSAIPIVGMIVIIVCAINSTNKNQSNYCRAIILMWVISFILILILKASIGAMIGSWLW